MSSDIEDPGYARVATGVVGDVLHTLSRGPVALVLHAGDHKIQEGDVLSPEQLTQPPAYDISPHHQVARRTFAIVLVEDPPGGSTEGWLCWLRACITGPDDARQDVDLVPYDQLPQLAGQHRLVAALYEHPNPPMHDTVQFLQRGEHGATPGHRAGFNHKRWAEAHRMDGPLAVCSFVCAGPPATGAGPPAGPVQE